PQAFLVLWACIPKIRPGEQVWKGLPAVIPEGEPSREKTEQPPVSGFVFLFFEFLEKQAWMGLPAVIPEGEPSREKTEQPLNSGFVFLFFSNLTKASF
ncbi:MAG: hypothetical protein WBV45_11960, partial [Lutimonas sp.]